MSVVQICNEALQRVGESDFITNLEEDSPRANHCRLCYDSLRKEALREHPWTFSIVRAKLPPSNERASFGGYTIYSLPADYIRLWQVGDKNYFYAYGFSDFGRSGFSQGRIVSSDYKIEGRNILYPGNALIDVAYIRDETNTDIMDALFRRMLSLKISMQICEPLTQSTSKLQQIERDYKDTLRRARRANAFEKAPEFPPVDSYISTRYT